MGGAIEFGAHLPLMDFGGHPYTLAHLTAYTRTAAQLGFDTLAVNDHLVFSVPWLDGPVALAAVMEHSERMMLATTVALAVVRGPVPVAKTLGAIDRLSGGRLFDHYMASFERVWELARPLAEARAELSARA